MKLIYLIFFATAPLVLEADTFTYLPITFPGSPDTRALGINSSGTVLIESLAAQPTPGPLLYLWKDGVSMPVTLPFTSAFPEGGINDNGAITGPAMEGRSFVLNSSGLTLFQVPGAFRTDALGINDSDSVVGWSEPVSSAGGYGNQGYIRSSSGIFSTINVVNSLFTEADGINNTGDVVGRYGDSASGHVHGFLLRQGVFSDVLYPGTLNTEANGINDLGDIVGDYTDSRSGVHGFVLFNGTYSTLDFPGAAYTVALGINNSGSIVGVYGTTGGTGRIIGFIASPVAPVPEPSALPLVAGGLIGLAVALRRNSTPLSKRRAVSGNSARTDTIAFLDVGGHAR